MSGVTVRAQIDQKSMAQFQRNIARLLAVGKVEAFELLKSLEYQTARRAIGTTKTVKRLAQKLANKTGGFDARTKKRMRMSKKNPMKWAFGEAVHEGKRYEYGLHPLPFLQKFGVVSKPGRGGTKTLKAQWSGSRLKMVNRGFAKSMWVGVLRAITRKYGRNKYTKGADVPGFMVFGASAKKYGDAKISKSILGNMSGEIVNSSTPIAYLNRRDNLATKAIKQVNHFLRSVLIPEAEAGFRKAWNQKGV